jgi:hypothetical protein
VHSERDVLAERLLLAIYAYGTNTGIRAVASGAHGHSEDDIRYVRRRYLTVEAARSIAVAIADATFAARRQSLWGAGSTAVGSDSTHVRALDQNLLTEWHSRYHGRGVLIYWHVERTGVERDRALKKPDGRGGLLVVEDLPRCGLPPRK